MRSHAVPDLKPNARYLTNFLGVLIDPKFFPQILDGKAGEVEPIPIPANWHSDIAEWAAALRAVDLSGDTFTVLELGCGWGCWLNNTGVAARRSARKPYLIGIEGDRGHVDFAREACLANGFSEFAGHASSRYCRCKNGCCSVSAAKNPGRAVGTRADFESRSGEASGGETKRHVRRTTHDFARCGIERPRAN